MKSPRSKQQLVPCWAFTLLELIVVATISIVLLTLVAGAARSAYENYQLMHAGQLLADEIGMARQLASSRNWTVYVYLYKSPGVLPGGYNAIQLWRPAPPVDAPGAPSMMPVDKPYRLPTAIVISEDATHNSPLLKAVAASPGSIPPLANLPPAFIGANYVAFAMLPSGMLAPDSAGEAGGSGAASPAAVAMALSCLTVVPARCGTQNATPANFVTVQINPGTGTCAVHRP